MGVYSALWLLVSIVLTKFSLYSTCFIQEYHYSDTHKKMELIWKKTIPEFPKVKKLKTSSLSLLSPF